MEEVISEEEPPGGTPFFKAVRLGKKLHLENLFIKFEGANITGTQKDRISRLHVRNAISKGFGAISVATCGNYGASIAHFAGLYGIRSIIGIPVHYSNSRLDEMRARGAEVIQMAGKYEDTVETLSGMAEQEGWYDSNPGSANSLIDVEGYGTIAYEIAAQLGHAPEYLAVPLGNGTTLAGIYEGFRNLKQRGVVKTIPRMIGASTSDGNPIVDSWVRGFANLGELDPATINETEVNEPLIAYRSLDGQKALDAIRSTKGLALYVSDLEMLRYSRIAEELENLSMLPASASVLAAAHKALSQCCSNNEVVAVITGRNLIRTTR